MNDARQKKSDQETITPQRRGKDETELSEQDLDKASGGLNPQPLPPIVIDKY